MGSRLAGRRIVAFGAILVAFAAARGGIDTLVRAVGIHHAPTATPVGPSVQGAEAEAFFAIAAVCVWMAAFVTRRSRYPATGPGAIPRTAPTQHKVAYFVGFPVIAVIFTASFVFFSTFAIGNLSAIDRSAYVQAHGLRRAAVVEAVQNFSTTYRGTTSYTATINVTVRSPAGGDRNAVVYVPAQDQAEPAEPGSTITVLLDPQQQAYAELPGQPNQGGGPWGPLLFFAIATLFAVLAVPFWLGFFATFLRRPMWSLAPGRTGKQLARAHVLRKRAGLGKWPSRTR